MKRMVVWIVSAIQAPIGLKVSIIRTGFAVDVLSHTCFMVVDERYRHDDEGNESTASDQSDKPH